MSKTYIPGLRLVLKAAYRYISRWQPQIAENLTEEQFVHVTDCLADLGACLISLGETPIEPNA